SVIGERLLDRPEPPVVRQAFHGLYGAPVRLYGEVRARAHREPVYQHRAGATHLRVAGPLRALEIEPVAQYVEQQRVRFHLEVVRAAVDDELHATTACSYRAVGSAPRARATATRSARRVNTATISRLYSAEPWRSSAGSAPDAASDATSPIRSSTAATAQPRSRASASRARAGRGLTQP